MAGGRQALDLERLPRGEVDAGQEDEREVGAVLGDRRLEVRGPDGRLAGARPDDDEVRDRVETASGQVASSGRGGRTGRAGRRSGSGVAGRPAGRTRSAGDGCPRSGRASARSRRAAPRRSGPSDARSVSSIVNHGRSGANQASTPRRAQASSSVSIAARTRPRLEPERLAGEIDRRGAVGRDREQEPVAERGQRIGARRGRAHRPRRRAHRPRGRGPVISRLRCWGIRPAEGSISGMHRPDPRRAARPWRPSSPWSSPAARAARRRRRRPDHRRPGPSLRQRRRRQP